MSSPRQKVRLRDFVQTKQGWIFAVAGYGCDDGARCMLRYVPDENGDRELNGVHYKKLDFDDAFEYLREHKPEWVSDVHIIPLDEIVRVFDPTQRVAELAGMKTGGGAGTCVDSRVVKIVNALQEIPPKDIGVTGSFLPGLQIEGSDIDFIVYGPSWFKAREILEAAKTDPSSGIKPVDSDMWHTIYNKRIPDIPFDEFVLHEERKGNRGMVDGTYFDLLFTRSWDQLPVNIKRGTDIGRDSITATVTNADFSFDSPAIYQVDHDEIDYVLSYTHTYSGQALVGEIIEASGMVEQVGDMKRLVVGTKREPKGEWIRSLTLLGEDL